jgi:hypothetical protein
MALLPSPGRGARSSRRRGSRTSAPPAPSHSTSLLANARAMTTALVDLTAAERDLGAPGFNPAVPAGRAAVEDARVLALCDDIVARPMARVQAACLQRQGGAEPPSSSCSDGGARAWHSRVCQCPLLAPGASALAARPRPRETRAATSRPPPFGTRRRTGPTRPSFVRVPVSLRHPCPGCPDPISMPPTQAPQPHPARRTSTPG